MDPFSCIDYDELKGRRKTYFETKLCFYLRFAQRYGVNECNRNI